MISRLLAIAILSSFTCAALAEEPISTAAKRHGAWSIDLAGMDTTVKPGDDFFRYVNGKWLASTQIPPDRTSYGSGATLSELSEVRVRGIVDKWAADKKLKAGSDEAKVAAIYRTFLDEAKVETLDAKPLAPYIAAVKKAATHEDVARLMGRSAGTFGSSFFAPLADREFYLRDNFKPQKERYQQYVADMLQLAGWEDPALNAAAIVALETKIAEAHWTRAESRDRDKTYNLMTLAELETGAPGFPWKVAFQEAGLGKVDRAVIRQNTALPKLAKIFAATPVAPLKAWQVFHITDDAVPLLSKRFVQGTRIT